MKKLFFIAGSYQLSLVMIISFSKGFVVNLKKSLALVVRLIFTIHDIFKTFSYYLNFNLVH